jgi:hypothetical protein
MESQEKNLTKIVIGFLEKYQKTDFANSLEMIVKFGEVVCADIRYKNDTEMCDPFKFIDRGDAHIEFSHHGDCEDFAHYYMRMFRLLMDCYDKVLANKTKLYALISYIKDNYVPLIYICKIVQDGIPDYHATMIMVRNNTGVKNISFEVTNPSKSVVIHAKDSTFYDWHTEHYFAVDNFFISRLGTKKLHDITFQTLLEDSFNY